MMPDMPFARLRGYRILGTKGSGKTTALVARVADALKAGFQPEEIAVVTATPTAAARLRMLLYASCGEVSGAIQVTTARQWALEILGTPGAQAACGRRPRMIADFERPFIMEDMKTCGMRSRRLQEMLKFLERGWTELADEDPDWLIDNEERDLQELYRDYLAFYEAYAEPEICNMALKYLRYDAEALDAWRREIVFADDYQLMNRTSQLLCCLLAEKTVIITADVCNTAPVFDSYPYAGGVREFAVVCESVEDTGLFGCRRSASVARLTANVLVNAGFQEQVALPGSDDAQADGSPFEPICASSPKKEFERVTQWVAARVAAGTPAAEIAIIHPGVPAWGRYAVQALRAAGFPVSVAPGLMTPTGDARKPESCRAMRLASLVALAGDPEDSLALRCALGYGDWLLRSMPFDALRRYASLNSLGLRRTLELAAERRLTLPEDGEGSLAPAILGQMVAEYSQLKETVTQARTMRGRPLLGFLANAVGAREADVSKLEAFLCDYAETEAPEDLRARLLTQLCAPALIRREGCVNVGAAEDLCGFAPRDVLVIGMVNGFFPNREYFDLTAITPDKQMKQRAAYNHAFYALACSAEVTQAFSTFSAIDVELAGKLRLKVDRVGLQEGSRVAAISPSDFLALARAD